jgi:ubiquinone/menaquinone biosynthesis C-methylase UbiE
MPVTVSNSMTTTPAPRTQQQEHYETAYRLVDGQYGIPDRKIAAGHKLEGKRILVLGCGAGNDVWYLIEHNEVYGVDYASSGLEVAERHGMRVTACDLNARPWLPFDDHYFDVIVCKDILEHVLDPLTVLREVRRVMLDDGYVVISVPNQFYLPTRVRILLGQGIVYRSFVDDHSEDYDEWNYMHIRFFTYKGFRRYLDAAGVYAERWFWDFGNLAHYHQPEMLLEPQLWKKKHGFPISRRGKFGLYAIRPLWKLFNLIFPRAVRCTLVSIRPGLLCSGFYVHCKKK